MQPVVLVELWARYKPKDPNNLKNIKRDKSYRVVMVTDTGGSMTFWIIVDKVLTVLKPEDCEFGTRQIGTDDDLSIENNMKTLTNTITDLTNFIKHGTIKVQSNENDKQSDNKRKPSKP